MFPHKSAGMMGGARKALFIAGVQHSYQSPQTIGAMGGQAGDLILSVFPKFGSFRINSSTSGITTLSQFAAYKFLSAGDLANYFDTVYSSTYITGYTHILRGPTSIVQLGYVSGSAHPATVVASLTRASNHQGLIGISNGGTPDTNITLPTGATTLGYGWDAFGAGASGYTYIGERLQDPYAANGTAVQMNGGSGSTEDYVYELRG